MNYDGCRFHTSVKTFKNELKCRKEIGELIPVNHTTPNGRIFKIKKIIKITKTMVNNDVVYLKLPVAIDKPIACLIKKLNKCHLMTANCCAGHKTGTVIYFDNGMQTSTEEPVDETNLYISFPYTDNTRMFSKYFKNTLQTISFKNIYTVHTRTKYVANCKYFNDIVLVEDPDDFVIRMHYNTDNFEKNQAYCIKFLTKIVNNYLKNNK